MSAASRERHARIQFWLTIMWVVLLIPSMLFWKESVPWLVFISVWANIAGHWSAYEGAKEE